MVKAYILLERHLEACKEAEEAKVRMPGSAQALALYGTALYHAANDEVSQDAQDQVKEALRIDPSCKLAAHTLLLIYESQRRFEEAIELYVLLYVSHIRFCYTRSIFATLDLSLLA